MKNIKYRLWDKEGLFFFYLDFNDCLLKFRSSHGGLDIEVKSVESGKEINDDTVHDLGSRLINDFELQQYTGVKDKNDIEIYEGDVLEYGDEYCSVEWSDHDYAWVFNDGLLLSHVDVSSGGIIGNIYENPELIKNEI